jgi:Fe-S-cluster containining protein
VSRPGFEQVAGEVIALVRRLGLETLRSLSLVERREIVDQALADTKLYAAEDGNPVSCRGAGCWGCCRGEVALSQQEWDAIAPKLGPEVFARALASRREIETSERTTICPVLDPVTKMCAVYEDRPLNCRAYHVVTPAEWCYPEIVGPREVASISGPVIVAGAMALAGSDPGETFTETLAVRILAAASRRSA